MLDQETIETVKSTAPILRTHGETLTRHFYKKMFKNNPEVAPFFNQSNQSGGTQQKALAGAITAFAANVDNLEVLGSAVELIANKHASLQIKPEHYPIVGENLLASIKEVLGEGATEQVMAAWAEAYAFLADIMINREKQIYDENANKPGGWQGFRNFVIDRKQKESNLITSLYLKPEDGDPLPEFLPGQYITLRIKTEDGSTTMRNYSLSDQPGKDHFRISVKKQKGATKADPKGYVSHKLHQAFNAGDVLEIGPPCGEFFLPKTPQSTRPLVLLAGGIGITPILSILKTALSTRPDQQITLIYGCLNEKVQAFRPTLNALAKQHPNLTLHYRYSDPVKKGKKRGGQSSTGFVDQELIAKLLPSLEADYYFCGPKPFMKKVNQILNNWAIPEEQINFEFFGPREELEEDSKAIAA